MDDDPDDGYVCNRCRRGDCARCTDTDCGCCRGVPGEPA